MINLQNLKFKHKVYLTELVRKIFPELQIEPDTLNSIKPGVLQFCLNKINISVRKKRAIENIINKIPPRGQLIEGEILVPEENRLN